MVYCQIWLNPPWNDSHVFYIFLRMNANWAKNKKTVKTSYEVSWCWWTGWSYELQGAQNYVLSPRFTLHARLHAALSICRSTVGKSACVNSVVLCILIPFLYIIFILFVSDFRGRDNSNQLFFSKETLCFFSSGVSPSKKNSPKLHQFSLSLSLSLSLVVSSIYVVLSFHPRRRSVANFCFCSWTCASFFRRQECAFWILRTSLSVGSPSLPRYIFGPQAMFRSNSL